MTVLERLIHKEIISINTSISNTYPVGEPHSILSENIKTEVYIQFKIGEFTLNIFNPIQIDPSSTIHSLIGKKISGVSEEKIKAVLTIEDEIEITVDLRESAYNGPEAMVLYGPNNMCVVWN